MNDIKSAVYTNMDITLLRCSLIVQYLGANSILEQIVSYDDTVDVV